ncbi:MAG: TraB/VirB10 family protein [Candidatus Contubernalis sp.]|nr:TraB/VirB10 family protein [Candidatus Contubernalis sp.]
MGVGGKEEQIANANATEGINTLKIQSEDQLKAVNDLIRMNQDLSEQNKLLSGQIDNLNTNLESKVNEKLDEAMGRIEEKLQGILPSAGTGPAQPAFARLKVLHVGPSTPTPASTRNVFLPAGSFVKGTLLTGVFAPGDRSNPLPVLFSVDEAFYGPARTRIPLKGLLGIGKAVADVNSRRAIIQVHKLSYVCTNVKNWEKDVPGYICGADGVLGLEGKVIRATGKAFAGSFISGFLSGAAEALAMGETTTSAVAGGAISAVTGDVGKFAAFSGLSAAAGKLSDYYAKMLDEIITAVSVTKGQKLTIVIQQGVEIEGYTAPANNSASLNY